MGRTNFHPVNKGNYSKCLLCDYEVKNNSRAMKLHFKYSHPNESMNHGEKERHLCIVCKKPGCKQH